MSETIKTTIHSTEALDQLSPNCIMEYLRVKHSNLRDFLDESDLEFFTDDKLIKHLGGIGQILEDHPEAVQRHVADTNASHEEDGRALYTED